MLLKGLTFLAGRMSSAAESPFLPNNTSCGDEGSFENVCPVKELQDDIGSRRALAIVITKRKRRWYSTSPLSGAPDNNMVLISP